MRKVRIKGCAPMGRALAFFILLFALVACDRGGKASPVPRVPTRLNAIASEAERLPADFQRGVNYAHIHRRGHGYGSAVSAAELDALQKLGVRWIAITPFGYQAGAAADRIVGFPGHEGGSEFFKRSDPTLYDSDLVAEVAAAHARGLRVTLKPHIWSRDFWDGLVWHGSILQPSADAHARWWTTYRAFAIHYARLAERAGADLYCIGTELVEMTGRYPEEWRQLIADVRKVYHGPLSYAAHWEREFDQISFWDALDFIGISAYFPLDAPEAASVEEIVAAWKPHRQRVARIADRFHRPVLFLEAGYRSVVGTHQAPWIYKGKRLDLDTQARAYEALFRAFADAAWWKGVYFWKAYTDPRLAYERSDGSGFSFRGRPAEAVIRRWYDGASPPQR